MLGGRLNRRPFRMRAVLLIRSRDADTRSTIGSCIDYTRIELNPQVSPEDSAGWPVLCTSAGRQCLWASAVDRGRCQPVVGGVAAVNSPDSLPSGARGQFFSTGPCGSLGAAPHTRLSGTCCFARSRPAIPTIEQTNGRNRHSSRVLRLPAESVSGTKRAGTIFACCTRMEWFYFWRGGPAGGKHGDRLGNVALRQQRYASAVQARIGAILLTGRDRQWVNFEATNTTRTKAV